MWDVRCLSLVPTDALIFFQLFFLQAGQLEDHDLSLECVSSVEAFPKKPLVKDDPDLEVPFPQLCGESVEYLGHASDAIIALSNYRLLIRYPHSFVNVSMMCC